MSILDSYTAEQLKNFKTFINECKTEGFSKDAMLLEFEISVEFLQGVQFKKGMEPLAVDRLREDEEALVIIWDHWEDE